MSLTLADRLTGALLGQALGDALGFVVEAAPPDAAIEYVDHWVRAGRAAERGRSPHRFGQYTDDTQFARELLVSIRDTGGFDPAAYARRIALLFAANRDLGAGPGSRAAALRLVAGVPWRDAATPAPYPGNGSAMRAAPLGVLYRDDPGRLVRAAVEQSRITHGDMRCAAGAVAVAGAAALAARGGALAPSAFAAGLDGWVRPVDPTVADAVLRAAEWAEHDPEAAVARLRTAGLDPVHEDPWLGVSSHVVPSVAWSLYAFLHSPDDYREAVCTAIRVGGDTDTLGAMTGALVGARLGPAALPPELVERITDRGRWGAAELDRLARDCAEGRGGAGPAGD